MKPILYEKNETQFTSGGLGRLSDCITCIVTEERNSVYECDFEYPITGANYELIQCGRIIAVTHDETGDVQPFDIVSFSRPIDGIVSFHAVHISYRQSKMTVSGTNINSLQDALKLLSKAEPANPFSYWTDKSSNNLFAAADGVPRSVKQMLGGIEGSILDSYGGEYEWDKWTVKLWGSRGRARDFTIRYGLNLMNYDEEVDYSDTYSSCVPFWVGSDQNGDIVVKGDKVSSGVTPYDGREACVPLDLSQKFDEQPTKEQLEKMAESLMKEDKVFIPEQTIKVEFVRLQDIPEYENYASLMECSLCDSVNVMFPNYDVSGSFKIVKTKYNVLRDRFDEMELGTLSVTLQSAIDTSGSSPSVTEVKMIQTAVDAQVSAESALASAETAYASAQSAQESAETASLAAQSAVADAQEAKTAATAASSSASAAQISASNALTAAQNAQSSADSALVSLATVEDVAGVLEWITNHGTMTLTSDVTVNPSHVYFVVDAGGDYVVGSTHYSIVSEPKDSELSTYYELSVDKSIQNYVATHLVVDTEGLWLIPDSGGNKVLIATGSGSTYTTAGTYIIGKVNGVDTVFAKFTQDNVTMGEESKPHLEVYKNGLQFIDTYGEEYFNIHDYRTGIHDVEQTFKGDGSATAFSLIVKAINTTDMTVYVNGSAVTSGITKTVYAVVFNSAPSDGAIIRVKYTSSFASRAKAYTIGKRSNNSNKGEYSVALGYDLTANGDCSVAENAFSTAFGHYAHAEGYATYAKGNYSHSEGWNSSANGSMSHAQNYHTRADGDYQTTIGKFNSIDNTSALIIGNGTADNARSNALTVDWSGNVNIPSGATYQINGTPIGSGAVSGVKGNAESTYRTGNVNITPANVGAVALSDKYTRSSTGDIGWTGQTDGDAKVIAKSALAFWNGAYSGNGSNLSKCSTGNIIGSNGGTMTGQLLTSFKSSVAMGSYGTEQTTLPNFVEEVRFSSGCVGSVNITTAYTKNNVTVNTGWYNFLYSPHRSGGNSGAASGDNCSYGTLILAGMTTDTCGTFFIRISSGAIQSLRRVAAGSYRTTFTPTSGNNYANYGGCYYEYSGHIVHVHIGVNGLTANTLTQIYTLPADVRPTTIVFGHGTGGTSINIGYAEIATSGVIKVRAQSTACGVDITYMI